MLGGLAVAGRLATLYLQGQAAVAVGLVPQAVEGGFTRDFLDGDTVTTIYEAARAYQRASVPTMVLAEEGYGAGSSRDWVSPRSADLASRLR
ncbi:hypothetical protein ACQEVF_14720 [Nonomuraea polychroma]|uniref:hypothetical protein n=1 Tax=Nonomuraea polychroma TaxID=46176 RepID=UPI003D8CA04D